MTEDELLQQIADYAAQARTIEPDARQRRELLEKVNAYTERFIESLPQRPAYVDDERRGRGIYDSPISERPSDIDTVLQLFQENVEEQGLIPVSGKFFGYIAPCSMYYSALGDYIAAITDEFVGEFSNCPGAVRMEHQLLRWMADLVGYPEQSRGYLASGGSIATLTAVVTAREARQLQARDYERAVVYVTGLTHHSLEKALHIAGMRDCRKSVVPMDDRFRMDVTALAELVRRDRSDGLLPWLVVGSSGTTDLGSIDPLAEIADVAEREQLWFHVDGAYGGFFILSPLVAGKFAGIERSDSLVMNPHKALYTPFGLGALLVRDGELLYKAHFYTANYMQDAKMFGEDEISPADLGPELTRSFRGPRLWLPLKLIGVAPFRAALSEKLLLTRYAYEKIRRLDGFEVGPEPELSILAFRYVPAPGDADEFNRRLLAALRKDGTIFVSSSVINDHYMIRISILSYRTHKDTVDLAIDVIQKQVAALVTGDQPQQA